MESTVPENITIQKKHISNCIGSILIQHILETPETYIDSRTYFSWERFFSHLLTEKTRNTYLQYSKSKLNEVYLHEKNREILPVLDTIFLTKRGDTLIKVTLTNEILRRIAEIDENRFFSVR